MSFFDRLSIGRKLTLAITLTSAVSLLCAFLAFVGFEVWNQRSATVQQLSSLADTIAYNSAAAVLFNDERSAHETLGALRGNRQILSATIQRQDGRPFVEYDAATAFAGSDKRVGYGFWSDEISLSRPVLQDDAVLGQLVIRADLGDMWRSLAFGALVTMFIMLLALLLAFLLGRRLQRIVSGPISSLAQTALEVSQAKDYSQRAVKRSDDEIGALVDSFNDMLAQIQLRDQQLERHADALEKTVAERTANMARLRDEAVHANQAKSDFLANMSHEIRTPMNAVIGMSTLLARTRLNEKQAGYLDNIRLAAENLLGIINDILDFSKIEANRLDFEKRVFDLDVVLANLTNLFAAKADEKKIEFILNCPHTVSRVLVGDALRLGQVLNNLTGNAVKFTERGEILIGVRQVQSDADSIVLHFSVRDTGIGLSAEQVEKLFLPFSQADASTTRRFGGTGLGLAISKQLVERMDGEIGVTSQLGVGSEFFFTARFGRASSTDICHFNEKFGACSQAAECGAYAQRDRLNHRRVLVVDDSLTARDILCAMLDGFGLKASAVGSAVEAIAELERVASDSEACYDLVLIDWQMPSMDGVEAVRYIRANARLPRVPTLIMVTAFSRDELMRCIGPDELDGLLLKPVSPSTLCDTLVTALGFGSGRKGVVPSVRASDASLPPLRGKVLLVDDNSINQIVARDMLDLIGLDVTVVNDGQQAVDSVAGGAFDLVLMDIQMPVMDGYEATSAIRSLGGFDELPILAMTAHAMNSVRDHCLAAGMNGHVTKPIDLDTLHRTLMQWLPLKSLANDKETTAAARDGDAAVVLPDASRSIDVHAALGRLGGKRALYRRILLDFLREHGDSEATVSTALANGEVQVAARCLHALKGVVGNLGMVRLHEAITTLEAALKQGASLAAEVLEFRQEFSSVIDVLGPMVADSEPADEQSPRRAADLDSLPPLLAALADYLREGSPRAADLLPELERALGGLLAKEQADLAELIESFDFDAAENALNVLLGSLAKERFNAEATTEGNAG